MYVMKAARWVVLSMFLLHCGSSLAMAQNEEAAKEEAAKEEAAKVETAKEAALAWLALVDKDEYEASWDQAGKLLRDAVTKEGWRSAGQNARGQVKSMLPGLDFSTRELISARYMEEVPNAPAGEYVVAQYQLSHSGQQVIETISLYLEEEAWKVVGYYIQPEQ